MHKKLSTFLIPATLGVAGYAAAGAFGLGVGLFFGYLIQGAIEHFRKRASKDSASKNAENDSVQTPPALQEVMTVMTIYMWSSLVYAAILTIAHRHDAAQIWINATKPAAEWLS